MNRSPLPARAMRLPTALLLGCASVVPGLQPAFAQETVLAPGTRSFAIQPQQLVDALHEFSRVTGIQVAYTAAIGSGVQSPGVAGSFAPAEALSRLLAGTGLTYRFTGANSVTLEPAPAAQSGTIQLGPVRVAADEQGNAATLEEQRRSESPTGPANGYVASRTLTASKTDTPILETPQSIAVISARQVAAQDAQTIGQALRYTAGVQAEPYGFDPRYDQFIVRGFAENAVGKYRDGLRQLNSSFAFFVDEPYGLERIEVLRGPASVLYGGNQPGGVVNTVTKRPTDTTFGELIGQIGNFGRYQGQFDLGGPLTQDGSLTYRLTGLARDSGTQNRFGKDDRLYIAPALTWKLDDRTSLTILTDYERNRGQMWPYYHLGADGRLTHILLTDPEFDRLHQHQWDIGYQFEHHFSDAITFRQNFRYGQARFLGQFVDEYGTQGDTIYRYAGRFNDRTDALTTDTQIEAKLGTGSVKQTFLLGLDHLHDHTELAFDQGFPPVLGGTTNVPTLSVTDPVYSTSPVGTLNRVSDSVTHLRQTGLYAQDQLKWGGLVVTAGGRYDWSRTWTLNRLNGATTEQTPGKFTGRVGAVYLFDNGLAPYVSFSTSFSPLSGTTFAGEAFKPTTGRQWEAGVKYQPTGSNSFITASLFTIRQDNLATTDPDHTGYSIQVGRARSRGAELSGVASLGNGFDLVGNYSYTDTRVTRSNGVDLGKRLVGVPTNLASLWLDYTRPDGPLHGLGLGGGVRYVGKTWQNTANTAQNPDYTVFDAVVHYDFSHIRVALNVFNIADKQVPYCNSGNCTFTQARTVLGSVRYRW